MLITFLEIITVVVILLILLFVTTAAVVGIVQGIKNQDQD